MHHRAFRSFFVFSCGVDRDPRKYVRELFLEWSIPPAHAFAIFFGMVHSARGSVGVFRWFGPTPEKAPGVIFLRKAPGK